MHDNLIGSSTCRYFGRYFPPPLVCKLAPTNSKGAQEGIPKIHLKRHSNDNRLALPQGENGVSKFRLEFPNLSPCKSSSSSSRSRFQQRVLNSLPLPPFFVFFGMEEKAIMWRAKGGGGGGVGRSGRISSSPRPTGPEPPLPPSLGRRSANRMTKPDSIGRPVGRSDRPSSEGSQTTRRHRPPAHPSADRTAKLVQVLLPQPLA